LGHDKARASEQATAVWLPPPPQVVLQGHGLAARTISEGAVSSSCPWRSQATGLGAQAGTAAPAQCEEARHAAGSTPLPRLHAPACKVGESQRGRGQRAREWAQRRCRWRGSRRRSTSSRRWSRDKLWPSRLVTRSKPSARARGPYRTQRAPLSAAAAAAGGM